MKAQILRFSLLMLVIAGLPFGVSGANPGTIPVSFGPLSFTAPCTQPTSVGSRMVGSNSAVLTWTSTEVGAPHELQYQVQGSTTGWQSVTNITGITSASGTTSTYSYTLTGLRSNTTYLTQARAVCSTLDTSPFSTTTTFRTAVCGAPSSLQADNNTTTSVRLRWTSLGSRTELSYTPTSQTATGPWTTIGNIAGTSSSFTYSLTGLTPDTDYAWRVRTFCTSADSSAYATGTAFRVECRVPTIPRSSNVGFSSALVSWSGGTSQTYEVQWRQQGSTTPFASATTTSTSYTVQNLLEGAYEWQVRGLCGAGINSSFAALQSFTTVCAPPALPTTSDISSYGALLNWTSTDAATRYNIQYQPAGGTWTDLIDLGGTRYALPDLTNGTNYTWRVQSVCSASVTSAYSNTVAFTAACNPSQVSLSSISRTYVDLFLKYDYGVSYVVQWRSKGSTAWDYTSPVLNNFDVSSYVSSDHYILTNLSPGTAYEYQVKAVCADGLSSAYTRVASVTTSSCNSLPISTLSSNPSVRSATLSWSYQSDRYEVRWRPTGSPTWNLATDMQNSSISLDGLTTNTAYEWQVRGTCGNQTSPYSDLQSFTTTCGTVTNLNSCVSNTAARLTWSGPYGADFDLQWRPTGGTWTTVSSLTTTTYSLTGLSPAKTYEWQVKPICGSGASQSSVAGTAGSFQTLTACPTAANLSVSTYSSICMTAYLSWSGCVGSLTTFEVQYKPQSSATWLVAGTTTSTNFTAGNLVTGTAYTFRVRSLCSSTADSSAFTTVSLLMPPCVCGTINTITHSGITTNMARLSWSNTGTATRYEVRWRQGKTTPWTSATTTSASYVLTNLTTDTPYDWQVRPVCTDGQPTDYSLIGFFRTLCNIPDDLRTSTISALAASVAWTSSVGQYELRYRTGNGSWTTILSSTNVYSLTGLTDNTAYEWQVKSLCNGGGSSEYSYSMFFTTQCAAPYNKFANLINQTSARLSWAGPSAFELQYRPVGGTFTTVNVSKSSSYTLTGLTPATAYEWQVRSLCDAGNSTSGYAAQLLTFQTLTATNGGRVSADVIGEPILGESLTLLLSPNPAETQVRVFIQLAKPGAATVSVLSMQGQRLRNWSSGADRQTHETTFDVTSLPTGLYLIHTEANGRVVTQKLVKK